MTLPALLPLAAGLMLQPPPSFDAASIKLAAPVGTESNNGSHIEYSPVSLTMRNVDLRQCIEWAYRIDDWRIDGAKISSDGYDILAKSAEPVAVSQLRIMLQDLLARRFQLVLHREAKLQPVYELTVAKGGSKLPAPKSDTVLGSSESLPHVENGAFVFRDVSVAQFAAMLHQLNGIDLPVIDRTGVAGIYDIVLKSAPDAARQGNTQTLFDIVREQLGLHLAPAKAPIEMLIIDRAERPLPNLP